MTGNITAFALAAFATASALQPAAALAQTSPSGPMFSTPASRSTTGAPILNDPTKDTNGIIDSAGGGAAAKPAPSQPAAPPAAAAAAEKLKSFDDWEVQCEDSPDSGRRCQLSGKTLSPSGEQIILVMSLAKGADATTMLYQAALPLGIAVQKPVSVSVDNGFQSAISVSRCTPQGCLLEGAADREFIEALATGAEAKFSVTTPEGQTIPIALSLQGFSNALAALPGE